MLVKFAKSEADLERCFPVVIQLRSHLSRSEFICRVRQQEQAGYRLMYLEDNGVKAVAGFRILDMLAHGRVLYVDDLVVDAAERSRGYGSVMLDRLMEYAKSKGCQSMQLDSSVQRAKAHRFYFRKGMEIQSFRFGIVLGESSRLRLRERQTLGESTLEQHS